MLKIVISCGGGMSSSALAKHVNESIVKKGWESKVQVFFIPFPLLIGEKDLAFPIQVDDFNTDFDIALLCPHLKYHALNAIKKHHIASPMYIIPALLYGNMDIEILLEDIADLMELYKDSDEILWHFPEEKLLEVKRNTSHRRWIKAH